MARFDPGVWRPIWGNTNTIFLAQPSTFNPDTSRSRAPEPLPQPILGTGKVAPPRVDIEDVPGLRPRVEEVRGEVSLAGARKRAEERRVRGGGLKLL